jgi:hypothetical protein
MPRHAFTGVVDTGKDHFLVPLTPVRLAALVLFALIRHPSGISRQIFKKIKVIICSHVNKGQRGN